MPWKAPWLASLSHKEDNNITGIKGTFQPFRISTTLCIVRRGKYTQGFAFWKPQTNLNEVVIINIKHGDYDYEGQ